MATGLHVSSRVNLPKLTPKVRRAMELGLLRADACFEFVNLGLDVSSPQTW